MTLLHTVSLSKMQGLVIVGVTSCVVIVSCAVLASAGLLCIPGTVPVVMDARPLAAAFSRLESGLLFDCPCREPCTHIRRGHRPSRDFILVNLIRDYARLTKEPMSLRRGAAGGEAESAASLRYSRTAGSSKCTCSLGSRLSHSSRCRSHLYRR